VFWNCARRRQCGLRLLDLEQRIDAGGVAIAGQRINLVALLERGLGDVELQIGALHLNIRMRDVHRQRKPCGMGVDVGNARRAERAFIGFAILAPEIDFPRQRRFQLMQRRPALSRRQRRRAAGAGSGLAEREDLRMRATGAPMIPAADEPPVAHDDGAHRGVRARPARPPLREPQRGPHRAKINRDAPALRRRRHTRALCLPRPAFAAPSSRVDWMRSFNSRMNSLTSSNDR